MRGMISAVIVNFNEAEKLERCLQGLKGFADEIVVVDLGSSDESISVCQRGGAKVYKHAFVPYVEKVRNYAVSKATREWILVLDPDEVIPDHLKIALKQIAAEEKFAAVNIPRKNIFFGRWIAHTNWWPDRHIRFFKKGFVRWSDQIHKYPEVTGNIWNLEAKENFAITHFGYTSVDEFMSRQDRYSTIEAMNLYSRGVRFSWVMFFWKPMREFLVRFIRHAGFLDGFYGFALTFLMMVYQLQVMVKLWERDKQKI